VKQHVIGVVLIGLAVAGCAKKSQTASLTPEPTVADLSVPATPASYAPIEVATPLPTESPIDASIASGSYKIRKGDTLYGIAKSRYGDGKQYTRIVQANPGLNPKTLKVGQTITVP